MADATKRYAVVTGANKANVANFIKTHFGKLDILINNAAISGIDVDPDALVAWVNKKVDRIEISPQNFEAAETTVKTNYYGAKETFEALINLLHLSDSPKIVNVSANMGGLKYLPNGWPKEVLNDVENITEEKIEDILNQFLKDFKEGSLEIKGCWPISASAYIVSKAALNALTRILAKKYPSFCINALHPGFVKTDMTKNVGDLTTDEGANGANVDSDALAAAGIVYLPNGWPKEVLNDVENITEAKIKDILIQFLKDFKEGSLEIKGCWPISASAYIVSKAALNALTRILTKKYPSFCTNALHPGFVKTDMTKNVGDLTPDEGAESVVKLALLPNDSPSGLFFFGEKEISF
ncbi:hypothetical protein L6164_021092 [Bauhinia variegata]|uniref:Uncharacterized protein n=1 Tax=Bauhinia variegata TaxID=167791 RepID=A0ACB9N2I3_BAUVA|nr:hypothetical protein L6164_021092 [Bauhinia variegata]